MEQQLEFTEITNGIAEKITSEATGSESSSLIDDIENMKKNGQVGTPEFVDKMRQMEVLLGVSQISPFGTNELEIFEQSLAEMSMTDLQKLANKIGVNAFQERQGLKRTLLKEFTSYTRNSRRNIMPSAVNTFVPDPNNPKHQKLIKILGDI